MTNSIRKMVVILVMTVCCSGTLIAQEQANNSNGDKKPEEQLRKLIVNSGDHDAPRVNTGSNKVATKNKSSPSPKLVESKQAESTTATTKVEEQLRQQIQLKDQMIKALQENLTALRNRLKDDSDQKRLAELRVVLESTELRLQKSEERLRVAKANADAATKAKSDALQVAESLRESIEEYLKLHDPAQYKVYLQNLKEQDIGESSKDAESVPGSTDRTGVRKPTSKPVQAGNPVSETKHKLYTTNRVRSVTNPRRIQRPLHQSHLEEALKKGLGNLRGR